MLVQHGSNEIYQKLSDKDDGYTYTEAQMATVMKPELMATVVYTLPCQNLLFLYLNKICYADKKGVNYNQPNILKSNQN